MSRFPARRALRRTGVDVELYNFEQAEAADSRGQPWNQTDASPQTINAIADPGGKSVSYGTFGVEVDAVSIGLRLRIEARAVQVFDQELFGGGDHHDVIQAVSRSW